MRRRLLALSFLAGMHALTACIAAGEGDASSASNAVMGKDIAKDHPVRYDAMFREPGHCVTLTTNEGAWRAAPLFATALSSTACTFQWDGASPPSDDVRAELEQRVASDRGLVKENPESRPPTSVSVLFDAPPADGGMTPTHGCDVCIEDEGAVLYVEGEEVYGFLTHDVSGFAQVSVERSDGSFARFTLLSPSAGAFVTTLPPAPTGVHYIDGPLTLRD